MPPLLAALPILFGASELGLGIANSTKGAPKAPPVTTIPGSPTSIVQGGAGLPSNSVLGQIVGSAGGKAPSAPAVPSSIGGGAMGGGRSASPPAAISGGGSLSALPWLTGASSAPAASPGTPGAI